MTLSVAQIRKRVTEILDQANITNSPIDVEAVARMLGAKVVYEELDEDVSGLLLITSGSSTIAVNAAHHENRQRFTIAHEIGHLVLHGSNQEDLFIDKKVFNRNSKASEGMYRQEIEANRFAAELLMPKRFLEDILEDSEDENGGVDLSDDLAVYKLARIFGVSEQALAIRLASLNLVPPI